MASQQLFTVNPSYTGPMMIADSLRKMKTNSGLNRMISTHNKRFFVLDLNLLQFYYLPDRTAHLLNSTDIPVANITSIKVTNQTKGLEEDNVWKYEFVITTKKKMLELISDSKSTMEKFLFAFSNIINTKTKKPLFNWDQYTGSSQSPSVSPSNLPLYAHSGEGFNKSPTESRNTSPQSSPSKQSERAEEHLIATQPQQTIEIKEAIKLKAVSSDNKDSDGQSDDQKENKGQGVNGHKKRNASMTLRRKASGMISTRGQGFEVVSANLGLEASPIRGVDASPFSEMAPVTDSPTGFKGFDMREVLAEPEKVEKLHINIQMNLVEDESAEKKNVELNREANRRGTPGDLSARRRQNYNLNLTRNNKSVSMKNMIPMIPQVEERGFVGLNEADLAHHMKKNSLRSSQNSEELQRANRNGEVSSRIRLGTGVKISHGRSQVAEQNLDSSPFGHEGKKLSLFKETGINESPLKRGNSAANKKSDPVNDDNWDNELFGHGKGQLSPLKPNNIGINQKQSSGSKYTFNEKKHHQQLTQRRTEFVSNRQGTHNDWDDDL